LAEEGWGRGPDHRRKSPARELFSDLIKNQGRRGERVMSGMEENRNKSGGLQTHPEVNKYRLSQAREEGEWSSFLTYQRGGF